MVKSLLWLLVTIAGLFLANPSKAALGWTLDQCKEHWGQPTVAPMFTKGFYCCVFQNDGYSIVAFTKENKVVAVSYGKPSLTEDDFQRLLETEGTGWIKERPDTPTSNVIYSRDSQRILGVYGTSALVNLYLVFIG
jgi:hypothetical protein